MKNRSGVAGNMRATVHIDCDAPTIAAALAPELEDSRSGTVVCVEARDGRLTMTVEAPDVSSLRAATRSTLRLIDAAVRVP